MNARDALNRVVAEHLGDDDADNLQRMLDALMVRKRIAHLDRAVRLAIIDTGQACALLELWIDEVNEARARDAIERDAND